MVTITREDIPIRVLASGGELKIPVFHVKGNAERPKVYIQANIHGPEIAGIGAIYDLLDFLREQDEINGSLTIVPSVNPVALNSKINGYQVGYADLNETVVGNFNRIYQMTVRESPPSDPDVPRKVVLPEFVQKHKDSDLPTIKAAFRGAIQKALDEIDADREPYGMSHGQKLASIIQHMSYDADYLIDLHTASEAIYHMYTFPECLKSVPYFDLHYVVLLDKSFSGVLDESFLQPWMKLTTAFEQVGRKITFDDFELEAFTPELGSADTITRDHMREDAGRVINYLRHKGVLKGEAVRHPGTYYHTEHNNYRRYKAKTGGLLVWNKELGAHIKTGDHIASIFRSYALTPESHTEGESKIIAVSDGIMINRTDTQVVHEGLGVASVMTKVQSFDV